MTANSSAAFSWADAWVFTSFYATHKESGPLQLKEIISMGDGLNRAIFTADELKTGFSKLLSRGLLQFSGIQQCLTPLGRELAEKAEAVKGELFTRVDITLKTLNTAAPHMPHINLPSDLDILTDAAIRKAIDDYLGNTNH